MFTLPETRKSIVSKRHFLWARPIYLGLWLLLVVSGIYFSTQMWPNLILVDWEDHMIRKSTDEWKLLRHLKNDITCGQWLDNQRYILIQIYLGTWTFFYLPLIHAHQQFRRGRSRSWDVRIYPVYPMSLRDPALNAFKIGPIFMQYFIREIRISSCSLSDDRTPRFHDPFSSLFSSYVICQEKTWPEFAWHLMFSITSFVSCFFFFFERQQLSP